ncbi:hypothetical protein AB751O23_BD_00080 [Chlamydiales bacterium SCGC AB-751-O23]|nr:hypothetical protein AB751O23_BD_00080 [Chlamydiales bacterium SCGC AB-751-O23]
MSSNNSRKILSLYEKFLLLKSPGKKKLNLPLFPNRELKALTKKTRKKK